jgi:hypothetical protein
MKKLRSSTIEPVSGSLINYNGMKQVNAKGIAAVNKAVLGAAIAYNLKKLLKFTIKTAKSEAKVLLKEVCNKEFAILYDLVSLFLEKHFPLTMREFIYS